MASYDFKNQSDMSGAMCAMYSEGPQDVDTIVYLPDVVQLVLRFREFFYQTC